MPRATFACAAQAYDKARKLVAWIGAWLAACADAHAAAAVHERLSRLSDAELRRRGMARADLHRRVFETLTRRG